MEKIFAEKLKKKRLTKAQKKIAAYFLENQLLLGQKSLRQVAGEIGVSDASVLRFVREIGYDGYNALKKDIHAIISERVAAGAQWTSLSSRLDRRAVLPADRSLADAFLAAMHESIDSAFRRNDMVVFDRIVERLGAADHKYIVGFRGCSGVARFFARTLRYAVDGVVEASAADADVFGLLQGIGDKDVLILLSFARCYRLDIEVCRLAQERKVELFLLTDDLTSPVASYADHTIVIGADSMSFYNSVTALTFVCEYIITLLCRQKERELKDRLNLYDKFSEFMRT
jgi:DNA-binding MurR/RpiR family transcriptional regulator